VTPRSPSLGSALAILRSLKKPQPADAADPSPPTPASGGAEPKGLGQFPPQFWLINGIELLERSAYYGMVSILTFYLVTQKAFPTAITGVITSVMLVLLYFVPLVSAALAEKYGYRKGLVAVFACALLGYVALGSIDAFRSLGFAAPLPGILLFGLGAGGFKSVAAAAVAKTTTPDQRSFGFTIYYACVNIGGFLGPLIIGLAVPSAFYGLVFFGGAVIMAVNLVVALLLYRNPAPPQPETSVGQALRALGDIRRDPRFVALLVVYSGFWVMYAQVNFYLGLYMSDFGLMPAWFTVPLAQTINPAVIILFGPLIGRATSLRPSLSVIIGGGVMYIIGLAMLAFLSSPAITFGGVALFFILGVAIVSIAEVMAQPSFLSYVSKVAPAGRTAVYLGYSFLPLGVGQAIGTAIGGVLYAQYAEQLHQPAMFWAIQAAIGALTVGGLLLVNKLMAGRGDPAQDMSPRAKRIVASRATPIAALALVPVLLVAGAFGGALTFYRDGAGDGLEAQSVPLGGTLADVNLPAIQGQTAEGQTTAQPVAINATGARDATFTLSWTDEPASAGPAGPLPTSPASNAPDTFSFHVTLPNGTMVMQEGANPQGGEGSIVLTVPGALAGVYQVGVELTQAGDQQVPPGVTLTQDTGNAWTLEVAYKAPPAS
jgi:proton-dependent oligopeptide transporter, POT family